MHDVFRIHCPYSGGGEGQGVSICTKTSPTQSIPKIAKELSKKFRPYIQKNFSLLDI